MRHIIKRQIIELEIQDAAQAQKLQAEFSHVYRHRIVPLIDQYCTQLSHADRIHRIDSLELDLGYIDPQHLEREFIAKIKAALPQALSTHIKAQEQPNGQPQPNLKAKSQLELFAFFARTGTLPWWADAAQAHLLKDCLEYLLQTTPETLRTLVQDLSTTQQSRQRIIYHYPPETLARLAALLSPTLTPPDLLDLITLLQQIPSATSQQPTQVGHIMWPTNVWASNVWEHILQLAAQKRETPTSLYHSLLTRLAADWGLSYQSLLSNLYPLMQPKKVTLRPELKQILTDLYHQELQTETASHSYRTELLAILTPLASARGSLSPHIVSQLWQIFQSSIPDASQPNPAWLAELQYLAHIAGLSAAQIADLSRLFSALLNKTQPSSAALADISVTELPTYDPEANDLWAALQSLTPQLPPPIRSAWQAKLSKAATETFNPSVTLQELLRLLRSALPHQRRLQIKLETLTTLPNLAAKAGLSSVVITALTQLLSLMAAEDSLAPPFEDEASLDLSFSDTEALYIGNAGLVILWPFIGHFFTHLNLLTDSKLFVAEAAKQRAAALLQYIATTEPTFPEYLLPLNKVLCGMALSKVFNSGSPLSEPEMEECDTLLKAVIQQAPILNDMSLPGFRGTFLLRQGILSSRDGAWLLQVERETYDVVLDRFPWSWQWVKLPWMKNPLRVEW